MAKDLYDASEAVRRLYQQANDILGFDLAQYSFSGPEETLKQTQITQPAIFVHSAAVLDLLDDTLRPAMAAGHSLGEYTALYAAGVFGFQDGLRLVKVRAQEMQRAGEMQPGTMAAIIGLDRQSLQHICDEAASRGIVQIANLNSPVQTVISGSVDGVRGAMDLARERGAKRVVELVVSGAFHSPLMQPARAGLEKALDSIQMADARFPVYSNVTGTPVTRVTDIKQSLLEQLTSPVRWVESIEQMIADGASKFFELGPGTVLSGLLKRINREVESTSVGSMETLNKLRS